MTNYLSANRNRAPLIVACVVAHLGILGCSATCKTATQRRTCASADDTHGLVVFRELREGHIEALKLRRVVLMQPVAMNSHTTRLDCDSTFFRLRQIHARSDTGLPSWATWRERTVSHSKSPEARR